MNFITFNQKQVAFSVSGKGKTLVFLHGFCEDQGMWDEFILKFEDYRVLRIDLPGFGKSELPEKLSIDAMADAVKAVLDRLKIKTAVISGHSMGGYVALSFLKKYKTSVRGLALFHSHPYADTEEKKLSRQKSIDFIRQHGHEIYLKQLFPLLFTRNFVGSNAFLMEKLMHTAIKLPPENIIAGLEAMMQRSDQSGLLKDLDIPVLFIVGDADKTVDKKQSMGTVHFPAISSIILLEQVAHMGMFEAQRKCIRAFKDFLVICSNHSVAETVKSK